MRLIAAIKKELLLLIRDPAGLAVLFVMPLALIILMALIQDAPFRDYKQSKIPVVLVFDSEEAMGNLIRQKLSAVEMFKITVWQDMPGEELKVRKAIRDGAFKAAILVHKGTSADFQKELAVRVEQSLSGVKSDLRIPHTPVKGIVIIWDPIVKKSLKDGVMLALDKIFTAYQAEQMLQLVSYKLKKYLPSGLNFNPSLALDVKEGYAGERDESLYALNSVQHNVPAWTIFGIFFIVLPLSSNVIREREQKNLLRLHLIPGSVILVFIAKILTYVIVSVCQFFLILAAGKYLMPLLGLPALHTGDNFPAIGAMVLALGLAAAGYGIFVGTVFPTHQQASTFGAVSVVILGAIGGIWVPVFVMPEILQKISLISPLGWGMNGFNDIFLKGYSLAQILPELFCLLFFSGIMLILSFIFEKIKKQVG